MNPETLKKIEQKEQELVKKEEEDFLKQRALKLGLCPICGEPIKEKTEISYFWFLFFKIKSYNYYDVCSKDETHYKEQLFVDEFDDC